MSKPGADSVRFDDGWSVTTSPIGLQMVAGTVGEHRQKKARDPNGCGVATAPAPRKLFPGARYSIGFALEVAIDKYLNHPPRARHAKSMVAAGLEMDTQTLWDPLNTLVTLLNPLCLKILEYSFRQQFIGADETQWRIMNETERIEHKKNNSWQVWNLAVLDAAHHEIQADRSLVVTERILGQVDPATSSTRPSIPPFSPTSWSTVDAPSTVSPSRTRRAGASMNEEGHP